MYFYESHIGGLYYSEAPLQWESLYCEECGEQDIELGKAETVQEGLELLSNVTKINGACGYYLEYALDVLNRAFDDHVSMQEAKRIVQNANKSFELEEQYSSWKRDRC